MSSRKTRRARSTPTVKAQRASFKMLKEVLLDLHLASLDVMFERGILPPLYGGEHLGEQREAIPLWGYNKETDDPALSIMLLRLVPDVEPDRDLRALRDLLGLQNHWPITELLETLMGKSGRAIGGIEEVAAWSVCLIIGGEQVQPAPGYDRAEMLNHIGQMLPYAVFPIIPVQKAGQHDVPVYHWDNIEGVRAEVVYADNPQMLEAAVWDYRLRVALDREIESTQSGDGSPATKPLAASVPDLVGMYDWQVMSVTRFYGSTSPLRAQQERLDVLREENGDLIIRAPLKPEIEPVALLAENRRRLAGNKDGIVLHLDGNSKHIELIWPQVRPNRHFCLRVRQGLFDPNKWQLAGYVESPFIEWLVSDSMADIYRLVHLFSLREFLSLCRVVPPAEHLLLPSEEAHTSTASRASTNSILHCP